MFSYYGSKSKVIDLYPAPRFDKIIEPFAGSARYALKWFDRDVTLIEKWDVIVKVWRYLQAASPADIMALPEPAYKASLEAYNLSEGERLLMGFLVARGISFPQKTVQQFSDIHAAKIDIAAQLFKIKHWRIICGSYEQAGDDPATWFIDPPYQVGGHKYKCNSVDFAQLGEWCQSRRGQVIVCENTKADWLPFWPIGKMGGAYSATTEAMWSNEVAQERLFA